MTASPTLPQADRPKAPKPLSFSHLTAIFFGLTLFFCLGNRSLPLIDRDEPRFAEASREMLQSGNWIVPTFNKAPRYDKPPLIYWMQVACYKVFGDNEFAARLPAALCTALIAILLILWGGRLADRTTGLRAAVIFVLCVQVFVHGRAAVADPPMVLCVVAAAWLGWEWIRQPKNHLIAAGFWIVLALGFVAKGPIAWVPIGMALWLTRRYQRQGSTVPSLTVWILGFLGMLGLVCLWGIPALAQTKGEFAAKGLGEHVVGRSLIAMEGHGSASILGYIATLPLYFLTVFPSFFPWSVWLPSVIRFHKRRPSEEAAYLLCGTILTFGIFTVSRTKLPHYTLPAFPFLALLVAFWWRENKSSAQFRKVAWATATVFIFVPFLLFSPIRSLSLTEAMVDVLRPLLSSNTAVALVDYQEPSLIWGLRGSIAGFPETIQEAKIEAWLAQPGARFCILSAQAAERVQGPWVRREVSGWNFAKGRRMKLVALASPEPAPIPLPNP